MIHGKARSYARPKGRRKVQMSLFGLGLSKPDLGFEPSLEISFKTSAKSFATKYFKLQPTESGNAPLLKIDRDPTDPGLQP